MKKMFTNQESNMVAEIIELPAEQPQQSPVSVLDATSFHEEDVSPLALSKPVDKMQREDSSCQLAAENSPA